MSYKSIIYELEVLMSCTGFGIKNLMVIQAALAESAVGPNDASDALFASYEYLHDLHDQMTMLVNRAIESGRTASLEGIA